MQFWYYEYSVQCNEEVDSPLTNSKPIHTAVTHERSQSALGSNTSLEKLLRRIGRISGPRIREREKLRQNLQDRNLPVFRSNLFLDSILHQTSVIQ